MRNSRLRTRRTLAPIESWRDGSRHRQRVLQASGGIAPRTAVVHREYRASASVKRFPEVSPPVTHCAPSPEGLHRAISTVGQELARHGGREGYRAAHADQVAWDSARRPKSCVLARSPPLQRIVAGKLKQDWSPPQIAGLVEGSVSREPGDVGVTRDDLSQPFCPSSRRSEKRAHRPPSFQSQHPPPSPCR